MKMSRYTTSGVGVLAINPNDPRSYPADSGSGMLQQIERYGWSFPYAVDQRQTAAKAFRASCTPEFFLYRDRRLIHHGPMFSDEGDGEEFDLDRIVSAVVRGERVQPFTLRSFGCSIKWSSGREPGYLLSL